MIAVHGVCFDAPDAIACIIMELCSHGSLRTHLKQMNETGQLTLPYLLDICTQLTNGVQHLHSCGIIHRDLKSDNALVASFTPLTIKWIDFGCSVKTVVKRTRLLSPFAWRACETFEPHTGAGMVATEATDVFLLGCTFIEVLTGCMRQPYDWLMGKELVLFRAEESTRDMDPLQV